MAAAGHIIGNHTWSHPNLARSSSELIQEELRRTQQTLQHITGAPVKFFRPPYGARRPEVLRIARKMSLVTVLLERHWCPTGRPSPTGIAQRLSERIARLQQSGRAANIVLHDGGHSDPAANRQPSVLAAEKLIAQYKSRPTAFVTSGQCSMRGIRSRGLESNEISSRAATQTPRARQR